MVAILVDLQQYVPLLTLPLQACVTVDGKEEVSTIHNDTFHKILFGGDQLTAARTRGAKRLRSNSERPLDKLEGFEPVCEDWHAKGVLLAAS